MECIQFLMLCFIEEGILLNLESSFCLLVRFEAFYERVNLEVFIKLEFRVPTIVLKDKFWLDFNAFAVGAAD